MVPALPKSSASARSVRFARHVAVGVPESSLVCAGGVGFGATVRVRSVYRVRHVLYPHGAVLAIAVHRRLRSVHWNLLVIDAEAGAVRVGVGESAREQHLVRT